MIYLAKSGKVSQHTHQEVETLKASGNIENFSWIWNARSKNWEALDPAPTASPVFGTPVADPLKLPVTILAESRPRSYEPGRIEALCHNQKVLITARLKEVTDSGCELESTHLEASPRFGQRAEVCINLFDPQSGKSENVPAKLLGISRKDGTWTYRVKWDCCPQIFQAA